MPSMENKRMEHISTEEILNVIEKSAEEYERKYHGCSQSVLLAIQDHLEVGNGITFRSASPLAAGIALMGDSCGALIAGMMALGIVYGRRNIDDFAGLRASMVPARRFYESFKKEFGSCMCRDIQESKLGRFYDLATEYEEFKKVGGYQTCAKVVAKSARLAAELILTKEK